MIQKEPGFAAAAASIAAASGQYPSADTRTICQKAAPPGRAGRSRTPQFRYQPSRSRSAAGYRSIGPRATPAPTRSRPRGTGIPPAGVGEVPPTGVAVAALADGEEGTVAVRPGVAGGPVGVAVLSDAARVTVTGVAVGTRGSGVGVGRGVGLGVSVGVGVGAAVAVAVAGSGVEVGRALGVALDDAVAGPT
jgi:hypothetical protein